MNYEDRQAAKLERYEELAIKNAERSKSSYESSNKLSQMIPLGQPILVGHHSEGRHRRHIKKIHRLMDKSFEEKEKSEYYEGRAENIRNPTAISSDDPEAIEKLKEKLVILEKTRASIKAREHQGYELRNIGANIRTVKKRIEYLKSLSEIKDYEVTINDVTLRIDKEDNRVRIIHKEKPDQETIDKLKRKGFRWSPYNKAWQRQINNWSIHLAKEIVGVKE